MWQIETNLGPGWATRMPSDTLQLWQSKGMSRLPATISRLDDSHNLHLITRISKITQRMNEQWIVQQTSSSSKKIMMKTPYQWLEYLLKIRQSSFETPQRFQTNESHLTPKDRQQSRSLVGVETVTKQPASLTEPLDHLSILWYLLFLCPSVLLKLNPCCDASSLMRLLQLWLDIVLSFPSHQ